MQKKAGTSARKQPRHPKPPFVGVGGKIEERVGEARDPWDLMREEAKRLREEPLSGFTYLAGALYEENFWRTRLRAFGLDGQNARYPQEIPGVRQAQTAKERSEAHGVLQNLLVWQAVAKAGLMIVIGAWAFDQVVAGFRRSAGAGVRPQPLLDMQGWLPGPPELSGKLFDVLHFVCVEARAEVLGYCMVEYPDDPASEQAAYLLAGLLRTRLKLGGNIGTRLRSGLSVLAGDASYPAMEAQLHQQLPGMLQIAWEELGPSEGVDGLRNLVSRLITQEAKEQTPGRGELGALAQFADREALLKRGRDAGLPPQEFELYKLLIGKPGLKNKDYGVQLGISASHVGVLKARIKRTLYA